MYTIYALLLIILSYCTWLFTDDLNGIVACGLASVVMAVLRIGDALYAIRRDANRNNERKQDV